MAVPRRIAAARLAAARMTLPPLAVDAAVAALCYVAAAVPVAGKGGSPAVLLGMALNAFPLIWRRRFPIVTTAVVGTITTVLAMVDAVGELPYAQLVATYTFAMLCTPVWRLVSILCTVVGITVSMVIPGEKFFNVPVVVAAFVGAYALGTSARARQDRIALLEERTRRLAETHAAIAATERERIARDMHDGLAHAMSLVVVQAEAGPVLVHTDPDRAGRAFDSIAAAARDALTQLRRTLGVLRADTPDGTPARAPQPDLDAVATLADQARRAGLDVILERSGEQVPVPAEVGVAAYRIVQESLTNTLRHAGADRLWIRLSWADGGLAVDVRDNGRGPAPRGATTPDGSGNGLIGMRERVSALGGTLRVGPGPDGTGFRVAAMLPMLETADG
jgi:signal transduction histidine kinase